MSQSYIKGPVCGTNNCPSRLYRVIDGTKVCQYGHVIEGDVQIDNEDDAADLVITKRLDFRFNEADGTLIAKGPKTKKLKSNLRLAGNEGKELYVKVLQNLLRAQIREVVKHCFNNDRLVLRQIENVVKVNWINVLDSYLSKDSISNHENKFQVQPSTKLPNIVDTIFCIYFSTIELNYSPIYINDLMELIATNKIPSVNTYGFLDQDLLRRLPSECLELLVFPEFSDYWLETNGRKFLTRIPTITKNFNYYYPLVFRILSEELLLPNAVELFVLIDKLVTKLEFTFVYQEKVPELIIIGFIIFAIKIHFTYLNNKINYQTWFDVLKEDDQKHHDYRQFMRRPQFESDYDLVSWGDDKIEQYLQFLNDSMIKNEVRGNSNDSKVIMKDRLERIFETEEFNHSNDNDSYDINEMLKYYAKPNKIKVRDIYIIEDFLFTRFSHNWFVRKPTIFKYYNIVELLVKNYLERK